MRPARLEAIERLEAQLPDARREVCFAAVGEGLGRNHYH